MRDVVCVAEPDVVVEAGPTGSGILGPRDLET
jgi:hypothetical protein